MHDEHVTYASNNQEFLPPVIYEDLRRQEQIPSGQQIEVVDSSATVIVHSFDEVTQVNKFYIHFLIVI